MLERNKEKIEIVRDTEQMSDATQDQKKKKKSDGIDFTL